MITKVFAVCRVTLDYDYYGGKIIPVEHVEAYKELVPKTDDDGSDYQIYVDGHLTVTIDEQGNVESVYETKSDEED